tara:strand:+ start:7938 stop:10511 length:2574 start_codon:yes stop_codon:yes gene_type:complete
MSRAIRNPETVHISYKDYFDESTQTNSQQWDPASFYQLDFYDNYKFRQTFHGPVNDSMLKKLTWYIRSEHIEVTGQYDNSNPWNQSRMKVRLFMGDQVDNPDAIPTVEKIVDIGPSNTKTWQGEVTATFTQDDDFFVQSSQGGNIMYTWEVENLNPDTIVLFFSNTGFRQGSSLHKLTDIKYTRTGYTGGLLMGRKPFTGGSNWSRNTYPWNQYGGNHTPTVTNNYRWWFRAVDSAGRIIVFNPGVKTTNAPAYSTEFSASQSYFVDPDTNTSPGDYPEVLSRLNGARYHDGDPGVGEFANKSYFWKTGIKFKNMDGYLLIQIPSSYDSSVRVGLTNHQDTEEGNNPEPAHHALGLDNPCTQNQTWPQFNDYDGMYTDSTYGKWGLCAGQNGQQNNPSSPTNYGHWDDFINPYLGFVQRQGLVKYQTGPFTPSIHFTAHIEEVVNYRSSSIPVDFKTVAEELAGFLDDSLDHVNLGEQAGFNKLPFTYTNYTFTLDKLRISGKGVESFLTEYKNYINLMSQRTSRGESTDWLLLDTINSTDYIEDSTYDKFKAESQYVDAELHPNTGTPLFGYTQLDTTVDVDDISYQTSESRHTERQPQRLIARATARDVARASAREEVRATGYGRYEIRSTYRYAYVARGVIYQRRSGGWGPFRYRYVHQGRYGYWTRAVGRYVDRASYEYRYLARSEYRYEYRFEYRYTYRYEDRADTEIFENKSHRKEIGYWSWSMTNKNGDVDTWKLTNDTTGVDLGTGTDTDFDGKTLSYTQETSSGSTFETKYNNNEYYEGSWATVFPNYPLPHAWENHTLYYTRANILQRNQAGDLVRAPMTGIINASAPATGVLTPATTNHVTIVKWW